MASFYRVAATVCLVALCGLQSAAADGKKYKFTPEDVTEEAYLAANLARNGNLPVHISEVSKDDNLVNSVKGKFEGKETATDAACETLIESDLKDMFYHIFEYDADEEPSRNYRQFLQESLNKGLAVFTDKTYPKDEQAWKTIWGDEDGANLAYLLGSNSTTIGCVIGKCTEVAADVNALSDPPETKKEKAVLFCKLSPATAKNAAPFTEEYFKGLIERTTLLNDMTEDDLKPSVENDAAATAVPTILITGFVAMLTAVSA
ncbi:SAG family member [Eimeria mitis]|uniref:SAG family member n=1 Tax=Eimeria mitis TaxID=44415 RepID=U6KEY2_9EIME|nr:SAG family member [Eimeria mitis]CDJ34028.1 SAG family member [Eimeria mitis]